MPPAGTRSERAAQRRVSARRARGGEKARRARRAATGGAHAAPRRQGVLARRRCASARVALRCGAQQACCMP
jgi:hypothetical protein